MQSLNCSPRLERLRDGEIQTPQGEEGELSHEIESTSDESDNEIGFQTPAAGKRPRSVGGFTQTPREKKKRKTNTDGGPQNVQESGSFLQEANRGKPNNSADKVSEPSVANSSNSRFSVIIKSPSTIHMTRLVEILRKTLPRNSFITRQEISVHQKSALFKISTQSPTTEQSAVESLTSGEIVRILGMNYGENLEVVPFDSSYRQSREERELAKQVIAHSVPTEYSNIYLHNEVTRFSPSVGDKIEACYRIRTGDDGRPSLSVRVVCIDSAAADALILEGLRIEGIRFRCERPRQRVRVDRCFRCHLVGHRKITCTGPLRCGKCAGPHESDTCQVSKESFLCCNCQGNHSVWYAGCKANRQEVARIRQEKTPPVSNQNQPSKSPQSELPPPPAPAWAARPNQLEKAPNAWAAPPNQLESSSANTEPDLHVITPQHIGKQLHELKQHLDTRLDQMTVHLNGQLQEMKTEMTKKLQEVCASTENGLVKERPETETSSVKCLESAYQTFTDEMNGKLATETRKIREDFSKNLKILHEIAEMQLDYFKRLTGNTPQPKDSVYAARIKRALAHFRREEWPNDTRPDPAPGPSAEIETVQDTDSYPGSG